MAGVEKMLSGAETAAGGDGSETLGSASTPGPSAGPTLCALTLDDDVDPLVICRALLESFKPGFRVFGGETSEQALQMAEGRKLDLIVAGFLDPGKLDGLQFITAIEQIHPTVPVIMASGVYGDNARILKAEALRLGAMRRCHWRTRLCSA